MLVGFALACAGAGDDDDDDGDDDEQGDAHPACDAYIDCVAEVSPDATAGTMESYGDGSPCWDDADDAATCEQACAAALAALHHEYPASEACDDGTPIASEVILERTEWTLRATGSEGGECQDPPYDEIDTFLAYFDPNGTTEFTAEIGADGGYPIREHDCTNDGVDISCRATSGSMALALDVRVADDLASLSGTYAYVDQCTYEIESTGGR